VQIVFRVDSSEVIGFGHLSRCMNLAEELRARGNDVIFICRDLIGAAVSSLEERLFRTVLLPRTSDTVMPTTPALTRAILTSSSLKGRMIASTFFNLTPPLILEL
jgi:UDP:flavonoid glycosyltransferase YjiC (YdhE family)